MLGGCLNEVPFVDDIYYLYVIFREQWTSRQFTVTYVRPPKSHYIECHGKDQRALDLFSFKQARIKQSYAS